VRLILNCDDLGADVAVNDAIFELMSKGRVTSATLLMSAPGVEDAVSRIGAYRKCSFGVHLNATQFRPLSSHPGLKPLMDESGTFDGNLRRIRITPEIAEGVFAEWNAQIERARAMGVPISHVDSHHHVHTEPALFSALKRIQKKFGIKRVRITRNVFGAGEKVPWRLRASKAAWNFALRNYVPTRTTDGFLSFANFYQLLQSGMRIRGTLELMCHPGGALFVEETELLHGNWRDRFAQDAELISFNDL
jgi:chitin disaccharide deacetylase